MRIEGLTLENFGSFAGRHTIVLAERGIVFVAGKNEDDTRSASNGAGKSTLFDALEWALFGEAPKGDAADSVINEAEGKGTAVTVRFVDADACLSVQRFRRLRGKSGLRLWVGVHVSSTEDADDDPNRSFERTLLDAKETQKDIETLLGLDRDVFRAAVYRSQTETFNFADATDAERKDILTRILHLEDLDRWLERAKVEAVEANRRQARHEESRANAEGELRGLESVDFATQITEWERQREARLDALRTQYAEKKGRSDQLQHGLEREAEIRSKLDGIKNARPIEPSSLREPDVLGPERATLTERHRHIEFEIRRREKEMADMRLRGSGLCPTCGQLINAEHVANEVGRIGVEIAGLENGLVVIRGRLEELAMLDAAQNARLVRDRSTYEETVRAHAGWVRQLELELRAILEQRSELARLQSEITSIHERGTSVAGETNPFLAAQANAQKRVEALQVAITSVNHEILEVAARQRLLEFWVHGFGPKGLKSYVLDARLGELNEAANQWVKLLTGGTVWVRFETQTLTKSTKTLSERLNIRVFRWSPDGTIIERNYRSWSGGERARISLGIDFGLSRLVAGRASKAYDLLILDEVFRHLDGKGREAVLELLQHLAQEKSSIFVIDHDTEFRGEFERVLTIRKRNGRSEVLAA